MPRKILQPQFQNTTVGVIKIWFTTSLSSFEMNARLHLYHAQTVLAVCVGAFICSVTNKHKTDLSIWERVSRSFVASQRVWLLLLQHREPTFDIKQSELEKRWMDFHCTLAGRLLRLHVFLDTSFFLESSASDGHRLERMHSSYKQGNIAKARKSWEIKGIINKRISKEE